jgi:hypothetical protein
MPKLIIKVFGDPGEDICELEQAHYYLSFVEQMVVIDGKKVKSYEELLKIISQKKYQEMEYIEVVQIPALAGG